MQLTNEEFDIVLSILENETMRIDIGMATDSELTNLEQRKHACAKAIHILATFTDTTIKA